MKALLITVALLVAVGIGTAFYLGWLSFSTSSSLDNNRSEVRLTLDKEKVKEDLDAVKKKAKEAEEKLGEGARELKEKATDLKDRADKAVLGKTIEGTIQSVDAPRSEVTVVGRDGKDNLTLKVDAETKVRVNDRDGSMADLKTGDSVAVTHMVKDGIDVAVVILVKAKS